MKTTKYAVSTFLLLIMLSGVTMAQRAMEKFGRNRIQYEQFNWQFLSSDNFDVYFYDGGDKIAKQVTDYLEEEFDKVTDIIGYPPYSKTKLFLYNSVSDMQQSNVGIHDRSFTAGGETQFVKPYIEVANPGNINALKEELLYKVSSLMVNEMMFGGSLKDMFQSSVLLNLPEWFINGASFYVSKGWSIEMDDYIREFVHTKNPDKLNKLTGREAALAGQSVWNFIAEKYGRSNISNILNYTRIIRNEEKSIAITLGIPFSRVMDEWQSFYQNIDRQINESYAEPAEEKRLINNRKDFVYRHVRLSPDGTKMAYTTNKRGRYHIYIRDLSSGSETEVLNGGYKVIKQEVDYNIPIVDWVDAETLGIVHVKKGKLYFVLYDLVTKSKLPRELRRFEQVRSIDFSDNGRLMIVSGVINGTNDLFLLSTRRDRAKRLTNDMFDDLHASFVPNTNTVVFSSNRISDTLKVASRNLEKVSDNFNLFFYNLDTTENTLLRITNTISKDIKPLAIDEDKVFYLSDQKGITNLFNYDLSTGIYVQVTNFATSIKNYDIDFGSSTLSFIVAEDGNDYIYYYPDFNHNQQIFTPLTTRQQVLQAKAFRTRRSLKKEEALTVKDIVEQRLAETRKQEQEPDNRQETDTLINGEDAIDTDNYQFEAEEPQDDIINTDNYTFDSDLLEEKQEDSFLVQYRKLRKESKIAGPFPYDTRFSADNLVTSFVIDPLRGFGILLETEMNDMLENHNFTGGIMATTDLRSGDIYGEYKYLKSMVDYNARFERNVIFWDTDAVLHRYTKNTFEIGASYPFTTKTRLSVKPFYTITKFEDMGTSAINPPVFQPSISQHYGGAKVELVFDNSVVNGMNIIEGSRAKVKLKHYEGLTDQRRSFTNISADIRHYQKIYREIVLAGRVFYGSFFGRSPKQYLLGGMDNWWFNEENTEGLSNPLRPNSERNNSDLLFAEYATNLRGFDYAALFGRNTLLFNAELRIPLIRALSSGPITSNFFRNLQFTGFFDIGSAWTGKSPFNEDHSIRTETIQEGNFKIDLKNYRNPWLYSYGAGLRTIILGYYMKFDVAWPVEDYIVGSPRLYVTLGYDF
ncbi:MAG: translocation protein TolB [Fulvivirga sp.]